MANFLNRARMLTPTTGTGTVTLGFTPPGYASFAEAGAVNGVSYSYAIQDGDDFEIGIGTYSSAGPTFSRDTVTLSKIGGVSGTAKINLSGAAEIFITAREQDFALLTDGDKGDITVSGSTMTVDVGLTPDKAFRRGNILGGVSQSGGVPTGAIIERGSNANGQYVRYADGTQICWQRMGTTQANEGSTGPIFYGPVVTWTYPATFSVAPINAGATAWVAGGTNFGFAFGNPNASQAFGRLVADNSGTQAQPMLVATGRWF